MKNYVVIPYDPTWQALAWAKKHCPSYITNDRMVNPPSWMQLAGTRSYPDHNTEDVRIRFYFGNERDATAFALKWA
jgi:hypothetical protein